jgi:hypothetical protein
VAALAPEVSAASPAVRSAEPAVVGPAAIIPFPRRRVMAWMGLAAALFGAVTLWSVSRLGSDGPVTEMAVSTPPPEAAAPPPAALQDRAAAPPATAPAERDRLDADAKGSRRSAAEGPTGRLERSAAPGNAAAGGPLAIGAPVAPPAPVQAEDKRADAAAPAVGVNERQIQLQTNTVAAGGARTRGPLAAQANSPQQTATTSAPAPPQQAVAAPPPPESAPAPAAAATVPAAADAANAAAAKTAAANAAAGKTAADSAAANAPERRAKEQEVGQLSEVVVTSGDAGARPATVRSRRAQAGAERSGAAAPTDGAVKKDEAAKTLAFGTAAPAALPAFAEPGGRLQWRIADGRRLESSSDGGTTWASRHTVGRGDRLRAGTAPAIDNAWAVGERGLVLRLVVPGGWAAVSRPAAVSLIAVSATGPQAARVTAADGQVFETADGGATWTLAEAGQR